MVALYISYILIFCGMTGLQNGRQKTHDFSRRDHSLS